MTPLFRLRTLKEVSPALINSQPIQPIKKLEFPQFEGGETPCLGNSH